MERFGGFTAAGPILQGFGIRREDESFAPAIISDLSRGSTVEDIVLTFRMLEKIYKHDNTAATTAKTEESKKSFTQRLLDAWDFAGNLGRRKR